MKFPSCYFHFGSFIFQRKQALYAFVYRLQRYFISQHFKYFIVAQLADILLVLTVSRPFCSLVSDLALLFIHILHSHVDLCTLRKVFLTMGVVCIIEDTASHVSKPVVDCCLG